MSKYKLSKNIKYRAEWFAAYGLDVEKNFLQAPVCECGCGEKAVLLLDDIKELFHFMYDVLMEYECEHCAIFAHSFDGNKYAAIKTDNDTDEPVLFFGVDEDYIDFFKEWDEELGLCCYGLLIEVNKGEWKVIET